MIRKSIDIFLTINLLLVVGYLAYLWTNGTLVIDFNQETPVEIVEQTVYDVFALTLRQEVNVAIGPPIEGYEPAMFLQSFPGLTASDFAGVEASIGSYQIIDGQLRHVIEEGELVHSAAAAVNRRGMQTLLDNVATRLQVDLEADGTITEVMDAISS